MGRLVSRIIAAGSFDISGVGSPFTAGPGAAFSGYVFSDAKPIAHSSALACTGTDREANIGGRGHSDPIFSIQYAISYPDTLTAAGWRRTGRG